MEKCYWVKETKTPKADSELSSEGTWTMPRGKLDFKEKLHEGALRELKEETGLIAENLEFISLTNNMTEDAHFITAGFLCEKFKWEPKVMEPDEITQWKWFPLDKLPDPLYPPSKKILKNYREDVSYRY